MMARLVTGFLVLAAIISCGKKDEAPNVQTLFDRKEMAAKADTVFGLWSGQSKEGKTTSDIRVQIVEGRETITIANKCTYEGSTEVKFAAVHIKATITNTELRFTEEKKDGDSSCEVHIKQGEFKVELSGNTMKWTDKSQPRDNISFTRLKD